MNNESVKFIIQRGGGRQAAFKELADILVAVFSSDKAVALEHATRIGVDHEYGTLSGIKKNGVSRFRPDAVYSEKLFAHRRRPKHFCQRALVLFPEKANESFQLLCLLPEVPRGANQLSQASQRNCFNGVRCEQSLASKVSNAGFDIGPGGVLREDCADDDFKTCPSWPPVLRAVRRKKHIVIQAQGGLRTYDGVGAAWAAPLWHKFLPQLWNL
jgi:hypothetical protein